MSDAGSDLASEEAAQHAAGASLIRDSFAISRRAGGEHWDRMTTAVLKNRILSLTNRSFHESDWGVTSFRDFVRQFPELVAVDATVRPAQVTLRDPSVVSDLNASVDDPRKQIRTDLWNAVLDFSSEGEYVWRDGSAVLVPLDSGAQATEADRLPTISPKTLDEWRARFSEEVASSGLSQRLGESLQLWQSERRPDWTLPRFVRRRWNATRKRLVLDELLRWFEVRNERVPDDVIVVQSREPGVSPSHSLDETEQLRSVITALIRVMTRQELEELRIPAAAYARLRR